MAESYDKIQERVKGFNGEQEDKREIEKESKERQGNISKGIKSTQGGLRDQSSNDERRLPWRVIGKNLPFFYGGEIIVMWRY